MRWPRSPRNYRLFLEENPMSEPYVHVPTLPPPARPWIKTARTVLAAAIMLAGIAPAIYQAATNHDPAAATGLAALGLAVAGGITRVMALPQVNAILAKVGLGSGDVEASRVLLLQAGPKRRTVAGEASPLRTGAIVSPQATVEQVAPPG